MGDWQGSNHSDGEAPAATTVTPVTEKPDACDLKVGYGNKTLSVSVPNSAHVVTFAAAGFANLKPGAGVFAVMVPRDHGQMSAVSLVVDKNGVNPSM